MVMPKADVMARAVYLAQLEAAKGTCDCRACQLLRAASDAMTNQFLGIKKGAVLKPGSEEELIPPVGEVED